jgi:hypothetical protein
MTQLMLGHSNNKSRSKKSNAPEQRESYGTSFLEDDFQLYALQSRGEKQSCGFIWELR